jgi:glutaredoxin 2
MAEIKYFACKQVSHQSYIYMQLKEELTFLKRENQSIQEYLHKVKSLADEIAQIDHPISDDDLTLYVLHGLGPDFREIAAPIRAREYSLTFEELHDLLDIYATAGGNGKLLKFSTHNYN